MNCHGCKYLAKVKAGSQWVYFVCTHGRTEKIIERVPVKTKKPIVPVPEWCRFREDKPEC